MLQHVGRPAILGYKKPNKKKTKKTKQIKNKSDGRPAIVRYKKPNKKKTKKNQTNLKNQPNPLKKKMSQIYGLYCFSICIENFLCSTSSGHLSAAHADRVLLTLPSSFLSCSSQGLFFCFGVWIVFENYEGFCSGCCGSLFCWELFCCGSCVQSW